jgi:RNA polymerase sigma-70 factor (ECF subfamily)
MVKQNDSVDLVTEAQSGNRESMSRLAVRIHDRLYPYLYRVTSDHHVSQDLLQEVLLTMLRCVSRLERPESFWPWICAVAQSKICQHFRSQRQTDLLRSGLFEAEYRRRRPSDDRMVLKSVIGKERMEDICVAVRELDQRNRDVLQLRYFERMPYSEIASVMRCTAQQARTRCFRAKESLRDNPRVAAWAKD